MIKNLLTIALSLAVAGLAQAKGPIDAERPRTQVTPGEAAKTGAPREVVRDAEKQLQDSKEAFKRDAIAGLPVNARADVETTTAKINTKGLFEQYKDTVAVAVDKHREINTLYSTDADRLEARTDLDLWLASRSRVIGTGAQMANGRDIKIDTGLTKTFLSEAISPAKDAAELRQKLDMLVVAAKIYDRADQMLKSGEVNGKGNPISRATLAAAMKFFFEKNGVKNPTLKDMLSIRKGGSRYTEFIKLLECLLGPSMLTEALAA